MVESNADGGVPHFAGEDAEVVSFADNKGWKSGAEAVIGYQKLEKKLGGMTTLPGKDASDEDWDNFTAKTRGRNVGEYASEVPKDLPEGVHDPTFEAKFDQYALDKGWHPRLYKELKAAYYELIGADVKLLDEKAAEIKTADDKTLRTKWGAEYEANSKRATTELEKRGLTELFTSLGINTHPVVMHMINELATSDHASGEMEASGGKGKDGEGKETSWHGGYPEVRDK